MIVAFVLVLLVAPLAHAEPAIDAQLCYENEIDFKTLQPFVSNDEYLQEKANWDLVSRPAVGVFELMRAYAVYRLEKSRAMVLKSDKAKHCYIGCVVALSTSPKVTDYLGWLKEDMDLADCDRGSLFEPADMSATSMGARLGARDKKECATLCRDHFAKRGKN